MNSINPTFFSSKCRDTPLSQWIPNKSNAINANSIQKALNEYLFFLKQTRDCIISLKNHDFSKFDPLVGENACQIRAVLIALIGKECLSSLNRQQAQIEKSILKIEKLLKENKTFSDQQTFQDLLNGGLEFYLTKKEIYLLQSYTLTLGKVKDEKKANDPRYKYLLVEKFDSNKVKGNAKIGTAFVRDIVKIFRQQLAQSSVEYVREIAANSMDVMARQMVSDQYTVFHNKLASVPGFWMSKLLMEEALDKKLPLVVYAKNSSSETTDDSWLYFKPGIDGYKSTAPKSKDLAKVGVVLEGQYCIDSVPTSLEEEFHDPVERFLAFTAAHRQYPNDELSIPESETHNSFMIKAKEWQYTLNDPRFLFSHIYSKRISNITPFKIRAIKNLFSKYGSFYRSQILSTLNDNKVLKKWGLKVDSISPLSYNNFTITIINTSSVDSETIAEYICSKDFCFAFPTISFDKNKIVISIEWMFDNEEYNEWNLITYAKQQEYPLKFIKDHQHFWRLAKVYVADYVSKETIKEEKSIKILEEIIYNNTNFLSNDVQTLEHGIKGLGKVVVDPHLKEKAKSILLHIFTHPFPFDLRKLALSQLKPLIKEPDVESILRKFAQTELDIEFRYFIKNFLENIEVLDRRLDLEILKYVFSKVNTENTQSDIHDLARHIVWNHYSSSNQSKFYSMNELDDFVNFYKTEEKEDLKPLIKEDGLFKDRDLYMDGLCVTSGFEVPKISFLYAKMNLEVICSFIQSEKIEKSLRTLAVRQCIKFLFMGNMRRPLLNSEESQEEIRNTCLAQLKQIMNLSELDFDIRSEIKELLELTNKNTSLTQ